MSDFSLLLTRVRSNLLESGVKYKRTTTTSAGSSTGSTMVSTNLTEVNDAWNVLDCTIIAGDTALNGQKRVVEDFTASNDTLDFTNNVWPKQVGNGLTFELTEPGIWAGDDLRRFIEEAANIYLKAAPDDVLLNYRFAEDIGSVTGLVDLPNNVLKFVDPIVEIGGRPAAIISPGRALAFDNDPYIPATPGSFLAYFDSRITTTKEIGRLKHKPATNATCTFHYIPVASFDNDGAWQIDEGLWEDIVLISTFLALMANERPDLANNWIQTIAMNFPEMTNILKKTEN